MSADADIDRSLMAAVARQDRTALAQLYDRHAPQMLGLACRILQTRRDAEDLLHDVFLEVWQKAKDFDADRGTVRTWLLLRVRSRAIDRIRTLTVARNYAMIKSEPEPESQTDEPSQAMAGTQVRRALSTLSEIQRTVLELSYFEGLSCREIAERCRVPIGTVKSRLAAALAKLRQEFQETADAQR